MPQIRVRRLAALGLALLLLTGALPSQAAASAPPALSPPTAIRFLSICQGSQCSRTYSRAV